MRAGWTEKTGFAYSKIRLGVEGRGVLFRGHSGGKNVLPLPGKVYKSSRPPQGRTTPPYSDSLNDVPEWGGAVFSLLPTLENAAAEELRLVGDANQPLLLFLGQLAVIDLCLLAEKDQILLQLAALEACSLFQIGFQSFRN